MNAPSLSEQQSKKHFNSTAADRGDSKGTQLPVFYSLHGLAQTGTAATSNERNTVQASFAKFPKSRTSKVPNPTDANWAGPSVYVSFGGNSTAHRLPVFTRKLLQVSRRFQRHDVECEVSSRNRKSASRSRQQRGELPKIDETALENDILCS